MFVILGCVAFLMLAAGLYFSNVPTAAIGVILVLAGVALGTYAYLELALTPDERMALLRRVHLAPAAPPDVVALTERCARLLEGKAALPAGSMTMVGAPARKVDGQAWAIDWAVAAGTVIPAGDYGCDGDGSSVRRLIVKGETTALAP